MSAEIAWKLAGVLVYAAILLVIGAVASRRVKDLRDYFAGGKRFGFIAAAFSARATGESAWLLLGLTGMGAVFGVRAMWVVLGEVLGVAAAWLLMCRRFKRLTNKYDSVTVPDYLESRFRDTSQLVRCVAAATLAIFVTIYVSAQIDATGTAFESFLGINYYAGALIGFGVVLVYIVSGGLVAVVWSDVFQGTLMLLGLVALPLVGLVAAGGLSPVFEQARAIDPALLTMAGTGGWTLTTVMATMSLALIGLGFLGSPQIFVRFLSLRSEGEINKGAVVAIAWTILGDTGAVLIGLIGRVMLTGPGEPVEAALGNGGQDVLPQLGAHLLPMVLMGLMIAIVLSAIMSTVDSLLVVAASAAVRDWYQQVRHRDLPDDVLVPLSRKVTIGLALAALALAMIVAVTTPDRTIFWFVIFGWSGISATFCPTMILSLFWSRFTARGAIAAMITGFACVPLFKFVVPGLPAVGESLAALGELPPAFAISAAAGVLVSLLDSAGQARLTGVAEELAEAGR